MYEMFCSWDDFDLKKKPTESPLQNEINLFFVNVKLTLLSPLSLFGVTIKNQTDKNCCFFFNLNKGKTSKILLHK